MEKQEQKQISIHDILPLELIQRILLGVPARYLARLRCVSKLWYSLISDPHFAELHLQHSHTHRHMPLHRTLRDPAELGNWGCKFPGPSSLYGFGYDASLDDYLVVVAWHDTDRQHHLDCFSLRTDSWINLDSALPKPLDPWDWKLGGLFLNGSIHWLRVFDPLKTYNELNEGKKFLIISIPQQVVAYPDANLVLLGGCLTIYCRGYDADKTNIWVMKDYKVHSSWTLHVIPAMADSSSATNPGQKETITPTQSNLKSEQRVQAGGDSHSN
ncbi:hypothetical protein PIB30_001487 [Stylosanthes scabra]|uniref:F-box domain-containing protein n=1 Tax=Stylosanthes scabra TaxID=79078 RepID=A0ABU6Q3P8_9FABA|nr:hypothetical protein [Stylosanthes scabra]